MKNEIRAKVVAITGASSGIGEAIARVLANQGVRVVLGARRKELLQPLVKSITEQGGDAVYVPVDVTKSKDLVTLVQYAIDKYGKLDAIINNAGIARLSRIDELDVEGWENMIDVNLKGVLYGFAAAIPVFKTQGYGHIINIISTSGLKIVPQQGVYAGTKNAIRTIAEAFRQESDGKIRITGISPGVTKSNLTNGITNATMKAAIEKSMEELAISPEAIANAVVYALEQPADVEVGDIVIRPSIQN
ncbi:MAG TPA: SDR family oxidoreductase [Niastella sp.]